jgi:hypothetical protein
MLLTAEHLDGAARIILTTYLKETGFHNMDKTELNYNIMTEISNLKKKNLWCKYRNGIYKNTK